MEMRKQGHGLQLFQRGEEDLVIIVVYRKRPQP